MRSYKTKREIRNLKFMMDFWTNSECKKWIPYTCTISTLRSVVVVIHRDDTRSRNNIIYTDLNRICSLFEKEKLFVLQGIYMYTSCHNFQYITIPPSGNQGTMYMNCISKWILDTFNRLVFLVALYWFRYITVKPVMDTSLCTYMYSHSEYHLFILLCHDGIIAWCSESGKLSAVKGIKLS